MNKILYCILIAFSLCVKSYCQTSPTFSIHGVFSCDITKYNDSTGSYLLSNKSVACYFTPTPVKKIFMENRISADDVHFNSELLDFNSTEKYYSHNDVTDIAQKHWEVRGDSVIPAMDFYYEGLMPSFEITEELINDTINLSDTLKLNLTQVANSDSIYVSFFEDSLGTVIRTVGFMAPAINDSLFSSIYDIVPSVLESFNQANRLVIKVETINYTYQTLYNRQYFLFRNSYSYSKPRIQMTRNSP